MVSWRENRETLSGKESNCIVLYLIGRDEAKIPIHEYVILIKREWFNSLLPHRGNPPASPQNQVYQRGGGAASKRDPLPAGNRFLPD